MKCESYRIRREGERGKEEEKEEEEGWNDACVPLQKMTRKQITVLTLAGWFYFQSGQILASLLDQEVHLFEEDISW